MLSQEKFLDCTRSCKLHEKSLPTTTAARREGGRESKSEDLPRIMIHHRPSGKKAGWEMLVTNGLCAVSLQVDSVPGS